MIPENIKNKRLLNKLKRKMDANFLYEKTSEANYKKFSKKYKALLKNKNNSIFILKLYHNYIYLKHKEKYKTEFETYNNILSNRKNYFISLLVYHCDEIIKINKIDSKEYENYTESKKEYDIITDAFKVIDDIKDIAFKISELLKMASKELSETKYLQISSANFISHHRESEILSKGAKASSLLDKIKKEVIKLNEKIEKTNIKFDYKTGKIFDLAEKDFYSDMFGIPLLDIYTDIKIISELSKLERNIESMKPKMNIVISNIIKKHFNAMEKKNEIDHKYQDIKDKIRFPLIIETINKLKDQGLAIELSEDCVLQNLHDNDYF